MQSRQTRHQQKAIRRCLNQASSAEVGDWISPHANATEHDFPRKQDTTTATTTTAAADARKVARIDRHEDEVCRQLTQ